MRKLEKLREIHMPNICVAEKQITYLTLFLDYFSMHLAEKCAVSVVVS